MTLCSAQYQLDDEMEEEDMQDTQNGPQLILVGYIDKCTVYTYTVYMYTAL